MNTHSRCHCGSNNDFKQCCHIFISELLLPKTAEQLMRSRFTAFKLREHQYLINSYRPQGSKNYLNVNDFDNNIDWLGLKIISTNLGQPTDHDGYVEFVAFFQKKAQNNHSNTNQVEQLHEHSYFKIVSERWHYISGTSLPNIKMNRNQPCFCGSGKKLKKCHLI